ncbi:MAG: hypothetical protein CMQ51_04070 [Gammaproteobacteria bacterium]|nr:hypothetical protein [Gammaproteobacteria bacterium]|tara:strand:+ start:1961 stop:2692 length:732 start_codon:yes stop_codon:yes gene_type:complete
MKKMILFMGKSHNHAPVSFQRYLPDEVHIITSDIFRKDYVRRLNSWSKQFNFKKGLIKDVNDLFESTSVDSLLKSIFEIMNQKSKEKEERPNEWYIGITGGTMHMAATASLAGSLINARIFYVVKPNSEETIIPNKHVIEFPSLHAISRVAGIHQKDLLYLNSLEKGSKEDWKENCDIPSWMLTELINVGTIKIDKNGWELTGLGKNCIELVLNSAISKHLSGLLIDKNKKDSKVINGPNLWA